MNKKPELHLFDTPRDLANNLAEEFISFCSNRLLSKEKMFIALSGGNTPLLLFSHIGREGPQQRLSAAEWKRIHLFWVDERCVPPTHAESNYGGALRLMIRPLRIPDTTIHRIMGEEDPKQDLPRYEKEICSHLPMQNGFPVFDWILLGMGEDGHTASLFTDSLNLLYSDQICAIVRHPASGQQRITLTGKSINSARRITFLITGESKAGRVKEIYNDEPAAKLYPAYFIKPVRGIWEWYLDKSAAAIIDQKRFS